MLLFEKALVSARNKAAFKGRQRLSRWDSFWDLGCIVDRVVSLIGLLDYPLVYDHSIYLL
jgi:hypothetical protein